MDVHRSETGLKVPASPIPVESVRQVAFLLLAPVPLRLGSTPKNNTPEWECLPYASSVHSGYCPWMRHLPQSQDQRSKVFWLGLLCFRSSVSPSHSSSHTMLSKLLWHWCHYPWFTLRKLKARKIESITSVIKWWMGDPENLDPLVSKPTCNQYIVSPPKNSSGGCIFITTSVSSQQTKPVKYLF